MKMRSALALFGSHLVAAGAGFAAGIYALPLLLAPPPPDTAMVESAMMNSSFSGAFSRDRQDSDALHWGEGQFAIGPDVVSFVGTLAPGPDYRLYLAPAFVETEADFKRLKPAMVQVGPIKTFENFVVPLPEDIDPSDYAAAIVWCEAFGQFITSGPYLPR